MSGDVRHILGVNGMAAYQKTVDLPTVPLRLPSPRMTRQT